MREFFITLKYSVINNFAINKLRKKSDPSKFSAIKILLVILLGIAIFSVALLYSFLFVNQLGEEFLEYMLSLGILSCIIFSIMITIPNASSYLFKSKDFNFLMSLPLKTNTVFYTKLSYLLLINYALYFLIYVPILVVYGIYTTTNVLFWILAILTFILLPLLPVTISSFVSYGLSLIMPKFKYKNLFSIIFSLLLIAFIMFISFSSSMIADNPSEFIQAIKKVLSITGQWAYNGMKGDLLEYLYFALLSIVPFFGLNKIMSIFYFKANNRLIDSSSDKKFNVSDLKIQGQFLTLAKKELKRYFGSPMYVLNTIVSPILSTFFILLFKFGMLKGFEKGGLSIDDIPLLGPLIIAFVVFTLGMTSTTTSSISLEGKQFWIIRSAPLSPKQIFHGKIIVNLVITVPFIFINTILGILLFDLGIIDIIMLFTIPLLFAIFMSYLGLFINLIFPRFDYDSDVKAVKQSISVMVTMFVGFAVGALVIILSYIVITNTQNNLYGYMLGLFVTLVVTLITINLVYTKGVKLYNNLVV